MIKIEDAVNKLNNAVIQQMQNIGHLPGSANQNKVGKNDYCLSGDRGIRLVREIKEEV